MARAQRNRYLSENENDSRIEDNFPYSLLTAVGLWRGGEDRRWECVECKVGGNAQLREIL